MTEQTLLTVVDPVADEQPALERAAWLAKRIGARVELFVCDDERRAGRPPEGSTVEAMRRRLLDAHRERLRRYAERLAADGIDVVTDARCRRPIERAIVAKAVETQPILVLKDTHYHAGLKRVLLTNTDWSLIRTCPAPLLLVKRRRIADEPIVLAAVDPLHEHDKPAELDRAILALAKELASALRAQLHVLHSFDIGPVLASIAAAPVSTMAVPVEEIAEAAEREHRKALEVLVADYDVAPSHLHVEQGPPHEALVREAEALVADFVVMGAVSRSGLKRLFIGGTAERALARLPCDLLVIKPPAFTAPDHD